MTSVNIVLMLPQLAPCLIIRWNTYGIISGIDAMR